ncbi:ABC transporter substrate-binding protein [Eoetvoesiella caeni]
MGSLGALSTTVSAEVKVGLTAPLSGPFAPYGQDQIDGFMLGLEMLNGRLGDQAVTVVKENDQQKPEVGKLAVRKLLNQDKVDVLVGLGASNIVMAATPDIATSSIPAIATIAGPRLIASAQCVANFFSLSSAPRASMRLPPMMRPICWTLRCAKSTVTHPR